MRLMTSTSLDSAWEQGGRPYSQRPDGPMVISFGGLVHRLREDRNLNQIDLAEALHWKGASSRVSDLENDRMNVDEELASRIASCFILGSLDRSRLLLAARIVPSETDIQKLLEALQPRVSTLTKPARVVDFAGRHITWNKEFIDLLGLATLEEQMAQQHPTDLELLFDPIWGLEDQGVNIDELRQAAVERYFFNHKLYGTEGYRWHERLILRLNGYEEFRRQWREINFLGWNSFIDKYPLGYTDHQLHIISQGDKPNQSFQIVQNEVPIDARLKLQLYIPEM